MHRSDVLQRCLSRVATIWRRDLDIDEKIEPRSAAAAAAVSMSCLWCETRRQARLVERRLATKNTVRREGRTLPSLSRRHNVAIGYICTDILQSSHCLQELSKLMYSPADGCIIAVVFEIHVYYIRSIK